MLLTLIIWPVAKFSMTNLQSVNVFRNSTKESKRSLIITVLET